MKTRISLALAVLALGGVLPGAASAQQKQTAEGAQKFLATVGQQGAAQVSVSGMVPITLMRVYTGRAASSPPEPQDTQQERYVWTVASIEHSPDLCKTRAISTEVDAGVRSTAGTPTYGEDEYASFNYIYTAKQTPALITVDIDWGKATIKRGVYQHDTSTYTKPAFFYAETSGVGVQVGDNVLQYKSDDPELVDRIEFAMKFLKASCDTTADTGF